MQNPQESQASGDRFEFHFRVVNVRVLSHTFNSTGEEVNQKRQLQGNVDKKMFIDKAGQFPSRRGIPGDFRRSAKQLLG